MSDFGSIPKQEIFHLTLNYLLHYNSFGVMSEHPSGHGDLALGITRLYSISVRDHHYERLISKEKRCEYRGYPLPDTCSNKFMGLHYSTFGNTGAVETYPKGYISALVKFRSVSRAEALNLDGPEFIESRHRYQVLKVYILPTPVRVIGERGFFLVSTVQSENIVSQVRTSWTRPRHRRKRKRSVVSQARRNEKKRKRYNERHNHRIVG